MKSDSVKYTHIVGLDGDGHFFVVPLSDRKEVLIKLRFDLEDGDTWANRNNEAEFPYTTDFMNLSEDDWVTFIWDFEGRRRLEFIKL